MAFTDLQNAQSAEVKATGQARDETMPPVSNRCTIPSVELRRTRRGWQEVAPTRCTGCGATLVGGEVLVGTAHCRCGTMHRTHFHRCGTTTYTPELGAACRPQALDHRDLSGETQAQRSGEPPAAV